MFTERNAIVFRRRLGQDDDHQLDDGLVRDGHGYDGQVSIPASTFCVSTVPRSRTNLYQKKFSFNLSNDLAFYYIPAHWLSPSSNLCTTRKFKSKLNKKLIRWEKINEKGSFINAVEYLFREFEPLPYLYALLWTTTYLKKCFS